MAEALNGAAAELDPRLLWKTFVRRVGIMLALAGGLVFVYNYLTDEKQIQDSAQQRARAHFRDILLTWHWNSDYGGVYIEKKPGVEANTLLEFPDITAQDGKVYTLRDPDTMSREIAALARRSGEHSFHITSLKLKNQENLPDLWERKALEGFQEGRTEAFESISENGTTVFRYMAPMYTERACLACHSEKVYRVGQIHGGISVSFDISDLVNTNLRHQAMTGLMILLSMSGVFFATRLFSRRLDRRLSQINRRYDDLLHSTESIVWEADAQTLQMRFIGPQVQRLLGYRPEEWLQADFWMQHVPDGDRAATREALARLADDGGDSPLRLDYPLMARDGRVVWMHDAVSVTNTDDGRRMLHGVMLDITERKNDEKRNQQLLAEQDAIFRNVLVGIVVIRDQRIVSCNRRFEEIFGYGTEELTGQSPRMLYDRESVFADINRRAYVSLGAGQKFSEEVILRHRDGRTFWGAMTGQALDPEQAQQGAIWIYADISQRRLALDEANKLRRAVEQSPVSIIITDRRGQIEYVNPRFTQVTGYTREEAVGENPRLLKSGKMAPEIYAELWQSLLDGREWRGQLRNRRKNGELIWEDASISPMVTEAGEVSHFIAVKEDITGRKLTEDALQVSEDRLKIAMEVSNDGIWDWHIPSGRIYLSPRWQLMIGYEQGATEPCIDDVERHVHPDDRERFRHTLAANLAGETEAYELEYRAPRANGDVLWILGRGKVVERDAQGAPLRLVGTDTDITERKQAVMQLEEHQAQLESLVQKRTRDLSEALDASHAADQTKNEFLANVNHEIRTPLNAIIGLSGLALQNPQTPRQQDFLEKISHAGQTLLVIVNDLLDLSKIAAGRLEMESVPFSLAIRMDRVRSLLAHRLQEKPFELSVSIDPALPSMVLGDPLRVEQILLNLLTNAIKFTSQGSVQVRLLQDSRGEDLVSLAIEVEDTGSGLSAEEIDRLFQPFAQADSSITRTHGGTGLGLSICRRLTGLMGGHIGVTSTPGVGSTFRAVVVLGIASEQAVHAGAPATSVDDVRYRDTRVLVVDDVDVNREIVRELLKQVGIACVEASNGRDAVTAIAKQPVGTFDLVFMDIQMPEMDGHSAAHAIRELPGQKDLPIVAMTAHAMEHERLASIAAGMNDHLGKPFVTDTFYRLLSRWIPASRQFRETSAAAPALEAAGDGPALPEIPGVDVQAGLHRFAGNLPAYIGWLENFRDEGGALFAQALNDLAGGRTKEAQSTLHSLKGRVGMLGMTSLWQVTADLESALKADLEHSHQLDAVHRQLQETAANLHHFLAAGRRQSTISTQENA